MTERHNGQMALRTSPAAEGYRYADEAGPDPSKWREARNGLALGRPYIRGTRDAGREAEVAAQVAAIRAQAVRNVREQLGPGPLWRRASTGWEPVEDEGEPA